MTRSNKFRVVITRWGETFTSEIVEATAPDDLTDFDAMLRACYKTIRKRRVYGDSVELERFIYETEKMGRFVIHSKYTVVYYGKNLIFYRI